jgi:hypothetical protein
MEIQILVGLKIREYIHITIYLKFYPSKSLNSYCEVSLCTMCLFINKFHTPVATDIATELCEKLSFI